MQILSEFATRGALREVDRRSIRAFVECNKYLLTGDVLDYGAGLQPYKDLVEGNYVPFTLVNSTTPAGSPVTGTWESLPRKYDAILCTQVLQYVNGPEGMIEMFSQMLWEREGYLVMTYPTNWPEEEVLDAHRFTKAGVEKMLVGSGFTVVTHMCRGAINFSDFNMAFGYGVVARIGAK